ncbi:MAG TPA: hypothetical protein VFR34_08350 [Paracoccaceae bacterium]|nr:hypothetical protein [Paracoccaceae bacterium]
MPATITDGAERDREAAVIRELLAAAFAALMPVEAPLERLIDWLERRQ